MHLQTIGINTGIFPIWKFVLSTYFYSDDVESSSSTTDLSSEEVEEEHQEEHLLHLENPIIEAYISRIVGNYEDTFDSMLN
jgi:hypothetical protein